MRDSVHFLKILAEEPKQSRSAQASFSPLSSTRIDGGGGLAGKHCSEPSEVFPGSLSGNSRLYGGTEHLVVFYDPMRVESPDDARFRAGLPQGSEILVYTNQLQEAPLHSIHSRTETNLVGTPNGHRILQYMSLMYGALIVWTDENFQHVPPISSRTRLALIEMIRICSPGSRFDIISTPRSRTLCTLQMMTYSRQ
ncbi:hypothetical protein J6590_056014 [Homalodisca vitripennis]|nr:hypothetical protein J6590_056014 [Homalodisca vitripennis]